jgi:hypothetical protein
MLKSTNVKKSFKGKGTIQVAQSLLNPEKPNLCNMKDGELRKQMVKNIVKE